MTLGQQDFAGTWQIARQIDDRHAGQRDTFAGHAVLTPDGADGLRYHETGVLRLGDGQGFRAERVYLWTFGADGIAVRFSDGREFHTFAPDGMAAGTDHPCGADYYRVTYDFTRWPAWQSVWNVTGPAKNYTMTSAYRRG
ncbi:hypothetical protein AN189_04835 [Loktanella sp. 3ANDIMAR09]|uniref:DUF6314 family protein n=1 Tax=Loktanella sp. 3ANDIMAR09 TaxID=1225657 RepID=UPI0006FE757D|nr:DUF6314 family protein [Loktanella sp. 3ANDIMAR09]KQI69713.1 hypothetical protein AN189_04835 [Loktanella sp. 3ANDIMAR09]